MATSRVLSTPEMGFPKYPELPKELRLQIIKHTIDAYNLQDNPRHLSQFAAIDSDWNGAIERILFKAIHISNTQLVDFETICGKRHSLLRKVRLTVHLSDSPESASSSPEEFFVECLSQLFHLMKGWSREDKRPHHLIKLCVSIGSYEEDRPSFSCDFKNLPDVQVIGSMKPDQYWYRELVLDSSSMQTLYGKLPNLYHAKLDFTHQGSTQEMVPDISSRIVAAHTAKPSLAKLSILRQFDSLRHFQNLAHRDRIYVTKALTPLLFLWSNSLVHLKINGAFNTAQFLLTASKSVWPHLRKLDLGEYLGRYDDGSGGAVDSNEQACSDLLEGLVVTIPRMQKLARVDISQPHDGYVRDFLFCMDLTPRRDTEWHGQVTSFPWPNNVPITPCGSLPTPVGAAAKAKGMTLPGHLVTELQDTVWKYRRLELAVFGCGGHSEWIQPNGPPCWDLTCTIWNRKTDTWDAALMNDMDIFIYEMGQYWGQVNYEHEW